MLGTVFVPEGYGTPPDSGFFAIVHAPVEGTWYAPIYRPRAVEKRLKIAARTRARPRRCWPTSSTRSTCSIARACASRDRPLRDARGTSGADGVRDAEFGAPTKATLKGKHEDP